jgi:hypothetical protein
VRQHDTGSVRSKLILMAVATTFVALFASSMAMLLYDLRTFKQYWVAELMTQADIIASVSAPALAFNDAKSAQQNLTVLRVRPQILAGAIYSANGARFAAYSQGASAVTYPLRPGAPGYTIERGELMVYHNIVENGEVLGTVFLRARYGLVERLLNYAAILGAVMLASLVLAALVASRLQTAQPAGADPHRPGHPAHPQRRRQRDPARHRHHGTPAAPDGAPGR